MFGRKKARITLRVIPDVHYQNIQNIVKKLEKIKREDEISLQEAKDISNELNKINGGLSKKKIIELSFDPTKFKKRLVSVKKKCFKNLKKTKKNVKTWKRILGTRKLIEFIRKLKLNLRTKPNAVFFESPQEEKEIMGPTAETRFADKHKIPLILVDDKKLREKYFKLGKIINKLKRRDINLLEFNPNWNEFTDDEKEERLQMAINEFEKKRQDICIRARNEKMAENITNRIKSDLKKGQKLSYYFVTGELHDEGMIDILRKQFGDKLKIKKSRTPILSKILDKQLKSYEESKKT